MLISFVFESDILASDSLVSAFVFHRECQRITRLHQTSIGINWIIKAFFDNQRTAIWQFQNIFRYPYSGAIKASGLDQRSIQLGCHSEKGAEHDHHLTRHPYSELELEDVANQAQ